MNLGIFSSQLNDLEKLLGKLDLLVERNKFPDYRGYGAALFRNMSYRQVWETCYSQQYYNFILVDNSLLLFRANKEFGELHYAYYEAPQIILNYSDFLLRECGFNLHDLDVIGDSFRSDYDQAVATMGLKETITPIRYDYEPSLFSPDLHPASHFHIGHKSNIRLGTKLILRPVSFALFVCRQCYPECWTKINDLDKDYILRKNVRNNLSEVNDTLWDPNCWEMFLS